MDRDREIAMEVPVARGAGGVSGEGEITNYIYFH